MSSIRLFILSSFDELGPLHGHRLRMEADKKRVPLWTDIPVGAVYGAMKRLASEGLLREAGQEKQGNRPLRQLYEITQDGREALEALRHQGITEIWFKFDPFDLALTKLNPTDVEGFRTLLSERLARMTAILEERRDILEAAMPYIGVAEEWALRHSQYRIGAEVTYLTDLLAAVPELVADQLNPRPRKEKILAQRSRAKAGKAKAGA